ncbi:MAG: bifunctional hydroxymethylpyrimidine kinase/phosphomethylpyrimidine kinase [Chloroflexi bacterium]|nr:bifunctional hydroxymethylpyrimidine kinase/phosphomethylpyrimidine kinase [Chloroflexota bacterium]
MMKATQTSSLSGQPLPVLTIAGSDSGGAAGLAADWKTFAALGAYGLGAITVVTAQNSQEVRQVQFVSPEMVVAQMEAVLEDYGAAAIKTGFIGNADTIRAIANCLARYANIPLVVDPVLVNHKGQAMFPPTVTEAYQQHLFPLATLITPNRHEAALLTGLPVTTREEMAAAAHQLHTFGPQHILIKGLQEGETMVDGWRQGDAARARGNSSSCSSRSRSSFHWLEGERVETTNTHGSGDTLSAAAVVFLAQGLEMGEALWRAHEFVRGAIVAAADWHLGTGHGPVNPLFSELRHR